MALRQSERQRLRREFMAMSGEAFDAMFDDDRHEAGAAPRHDARRPPGTGAPEVPLPEVPVGLFFPWT